MKRVMALTIFFSVVAVVIFAGKNKQAVEPEGESTLVLDPAWLYQLQQSRIPEADRRPADQTFLTFPEWYLVFSPAEQAEYAQTATSTTFPLMTHVDQVWDSYAAISTQIAPYFEYNDDYHFMIQFIGVSTTVEYGAKAVYETLIGRMTNTAPGSPLTPEDQFNARYLQDYVDFLAQQPWYNFDYGEQLGKLWFDTDLFGGKVIRKLERRYFLTSELLVKMAYAKLVAMGASSMYQNVILSTAVIVDDFPEELTANKAFTVENIFDDGAVLARLPRYAAFRPAAIELATSGATFKEIAGNDSAILLTVLVDKADQLENSTKATVLFEQDSQSALSQKRIGLVTTVPLLAAVLNELISTGVEIEHIYDY